MGGCVGCKREDIKRIQSSSKKSDYDAMLPPGSSTRIETKNIIPKNNSSIFQNYRLVKLIGRGAYGQVYKVVHLDSCMVRALKIIKKDYINLQDDGKEFLKEIEILIKSSHPNIMKIFEYFTDAINYYLIIEYLPMSNLKKVIADLDILSEVIVAEIFKQLIMAVCYIHSKNIVHRDIKAENILVENFSEQEPAKIVIKLGDFGTSNYILKNESLITRVGTPYYMAPEVLKNNYNEKCDVWSAGVLLYLLLIGYTPFEGKNSTEIKEKIKIGVFTQKSEFLALTSEAQSLIKDLLHYDYKTRISAEEVLQHTWITKRTINKKMTKELRGVIKNLKDFQFKDQLQLTGLAFIVHFIESNKETEKLINIFKSIDINGDGRLSFKELKDGLIKVKGQFISEQEIIDIFDKIDQDKDGFLDYEEFIRVSIDKNALFSDKNMRLIFKNFDRDNDGILKTHDIKSVLDTNDDQYCKEIIEKMDLDHNGEINYEEFAQLMKHIVKLKTNQNYNRTKSKTHNVTNKCSIKLLTDQDKITEIKENDMAVKSFIDHHGLDLCLEEEQVNSKKFLS